MKRRIKNKILNSRRYNDIVTALKKRQLRKKEISFYDILLIFIDKLKKDEIFERANSVAFNFTLAIFPAIIFLFTLIPYLEFFIPQIHTKIMDFFRDVMPGSMYEVASYTIEDIISKPRGGLLSFGFLLALYLATNGMNSLMVAFNKCYRTVERRSFLHTRLIATVLTFILAIVLVLAIVLLIIGQQLIRILEDLPYVDEYVVYLIIIMRFVVVFMVFFTAISSIYFLAPAISIRWKFFSIGSLLATFLSLAISYGFSFYINNFATYNKLYGSIGALIALMIWLSILSAILLFGFEVNASIDKASKSLLDKKINKLITVREKGRPADKNV